MKNSDICKKLGCAPSSLVRVRRQYGLKKSGEYMRKTQRDCTSEASKVNKWLFKGVFKGVPHRGGFTKEYLVEKFGEEWYEATRKRRLAACKKADDRDRLRKSLGMEPIGKKIKLDCLSRKAIVYKYYMTSKLGYYSERRSRDIYFDGETRRSLRSEESARRYGFRIVSEDGVVQGQNTDKKADYGTFIVGERKWN